MAKVKITAIADTSEISKSVQDFIDRNPELQDGAVIIKVDVEGCQGRRRTDEIRQFLDEDEVSDQSSVSKVEVQWISTKALNFKSAVHTRLSTLKRKYCIPFSSMNILPISKLEEYLIEVEAVREYFKEGIQNALDNYEYYIQMEKDRSPKLADLIEKLRMTRKDFENSFLFQISHPIPFTPMSIDGNDLGDRYSVGLIQDIALTAESIYASCTKPKIDQAFVEKLSNLKDKVVSFMFLDNRATKIADSIQSVLNHLPSGNLDSPLHMSLFREWLLLLSDTNRLNKIMDGDDLVTSFISEIKNRFNDLDDQLANKTGSKFVDPFATKVTQANTPASTLPPVSNTDAVQKKVTFSTPLNF
ncbi:DUF3150 domain-containing protein [Klebsiella quasipneumoniae]|uniref:DUF3150 domain-containing protein n=1 Tax=Klebsiella quasipneumoniae TaxID=1463165 RepID=UPI001FCA74C7|nr:DUF3150 domain-containing protein [Klebsiella quasipneumoniae]MCJ7364595.1 DUF3150 domain-containing protein [Klebsiella quasipneumoniae]